MDAVIAQLGQGIVDGALLDRDHADRLSRVDGDELHDLFYWANKVRLKAFGRSVTFCSIGAGKVGKCSEDCRFCAQSARYARAGDPQATCGGGWMTGEQMISAAADAAERGAQSFGIVNSGRGPSDTELDRLAGPFTKIASAGRVHLCASLGCLTDAQARRLVELGVRRYNHNLETSRRFYPQVVTTHSYDERLATLQAARAAGMQLCSGGIFNLGETWADRMDMAFELRGLAVEMVPLNFLHPIPGTPMADRPALDPMDALKIIALYRLILPTTQLKVAGGREVNLRDLQSWMFYCGATSCMVGNYLTTTGRPVELDRRMVADLGLAWTSECR